MDVRPTSHIIVVLVGLCTVFDLLSLSTALKQQSLLKHAKSVLDGNWVSDMNSTLPSPNLYPHQWSWDAAFVAIGYSHYDTRRAVDEMGALFRAQWRNGLLPHIVFNPATDESYFPGPSFWKIHTSESHPLEAHTSGIVQPPVHSIASLKIYENAKTMNEKDVAFQYLEKIYPKLLMWHDYMYKERDPAGEGLVFIRHMWESGMDNSPAWDDALDAIHLEPDDIPEYTRVDKGKVGHHKERPTSFFYDRAVYLIKMFYDNSYDEAAIFNKSPFLVQDVLFNSILARAGEALGMIAEIISKPKDAVRHFAQAEKTASAITAKLYDPEEKFFFDYDMVAKKLIRSPISGGFVALFGAKIDKEHVVSLTKHLYSSGFLGHDLSAWTIPSVSRHDPSYTNTTYWKGPAWLNINYLVRDGLLRAGVDNHDAMKVATYLKDRSLELVQRNGFYEYFHPITGSPHGAHHFSWSAALAIDWMCTSAGSSSDTSPRHFTEDVLSILLGINVQVIYYVGFLGFVTIAMASWVMTRNPDGDVKKKARLQIRPEIRKKKASVDEARVIVPSSVTRLQRTRVMVPARRLS